MKRKLLMAGAAALVAGYALTAQAVLKPGDPAPDFSTQASLGGNTYTYSLADALKKGPVVLYFYPAAFTKGCTIEAHAFAEAVDRYKAYGATVIGVSADEIGTLTKFSVSECRSKFPVAADPDARSCCISIRPPSRKDARSRRMRLPKRSTGTRHTARP